MNRRSFLGGIAGLASWAHFSRLEGLAAQAAATNFLGFRFTDVTTQAGIQFQHNSGAFGGKFLPETMGSGCAFLDYDRDGWQDILLINGSDWPGHKKSRTTLRLYHNNGNGTFTDVTTRAGLDVELYGMGVAVGDYNNDGFPDILVTGVGQNRLFRNTGKGTFVAEKKLAPHPNEIRAYLGREIQGVRCVYEARRVIESFMVELAADRIGAKGVAALEHHMEEMRTIASSPSPDLNAFAESHYRFDLVVADACGNPVLTGIFKSLREVELETHLKILGLSGRIENSIKTHEQLLKAIRSKNRREARIASRRHFDAALRFLDRLLETEEAKG